VLSTTPVDVWPKVRHGTRGTYCFEGNFLFAEALAMIGFQAALIPVPR
jgi:arylamine N-acetyltransferase